MQQMSRLLKEFKEQTLSRHINEEDRDRLIEQGLAQFTKFAHTLQDYGEVLMALYLCVQYYGSPKVFQTLLVKNNSFREVEPSWSLLFTEPNIFGTLTKNQQST